MPQRPDLRELSREIREALADEPRERLLDILAHVLREYVALGDTPVLFARREELSDLAGLSFAELIVELQTRLDHPELELFSVDDGRVSLRTETGTVALGAPTDRGTSRRSPPTSRSSAPTPPPDSAAAEAVAMGRGELIGGVPGVVRAPPSRPTPTAHGERVPQPQVPAPTPEPRGAVAAEPKQDEEGDEGKAADAKDDASVRFSLLELD